LTLPIYLDHHSTTPVDERVVAAMLPYFTEKFGNAASKNHVFGWTAEAAVDRGREQLAALLGGSPAEIVFTSGATEANNLAIKGAARFYRDRAADTPHLVTVQTEHKSVLDSCVALEREGFRVTYLRPDADGLISPAQLAEAVCADTLLVSVMFANNEIGVVQPIAALRAAVAEANAKTLFHCDAVQGAGKLPLDVAEIGVDLLSISAHKMYGPKGVGALWVRRSRPRVRLEPMIHGGGHERGLRSGTLPVPLIVGFGVACELCADYAAEAERLGDLRDRLLAAISDGLDGVFVNGSMASRLPGNLNLSFADVDGEALLLSLRDVAVSSGAACSSATAEPSYVLRAIGRDKELAHSSLRFGIGRGNTAEEIDHVAELVRASVARLRAVHAATRGASDSEPNNEEASVGV